VDGVFARDDVRDGGAAAGLAGAAGAGFRVFGHCWMVGLVGERGCLEGGLWWACTYFGGVVGAGTVGLWNLLSWCGVVFCEFVFVASLSRAVGFMVT